MIPFLLGLVIGGVLGMLASALCVIAREADERLAHRPCRCRACTTERQIVDDQWATIGARIDAERAGRPRIVS